MPILNYTTSVDATKTAGEIQSILVKAKAQVVLNEYDEHGVLTAISFRIRTASGLVSFRLPANTQRIFQVLVREQVPPRYRTREQASRVAWRITKDWVEAQLALVRAEMVDFEQVFLPYAQNPATGQTVYEQFRERKFAGLCLPPA